MIEAATPSNSYDEVPYASYPFAQSQPDVLATIATLFGMRPAAVSTCRVLEMGCSSGGNLIPLAERFPNSTFLGVDASSRQIAMGQNDIKVAGLTNVELRHMDILDIGAELGRFDYIVVHGVYSWVPDKVQRKLLEVCAENLEPRGVAYVSYNTNPGWRMRGVIRDIMSYRATGIEEPAERLRQGRSLLDFIAGAVSVDNPYGAFLKREVDQLRDKEDYYLLHEYLEEVNEPLYFHEFVDRAQLAGLQYLGEADYGSMSPRNLPPQVETVFSTIASDVVQLEQYMDLLRNRTFRQTLLCHSDVRLNRIPAPETVLGMHICSKVKPEKPVDDLRSREKVVFRGAKATTTSSEPIVKAALAHLGNVWPRSVPFSELLAVSQAKLNPGPTVVGTSSTSGEGRRLADMLIRCYSTGQVELSVNPTCFTLHVADTPQASAYARLQAGRTNTVTNLRHENTRLRDLERQVLIKLDGSNDREKVVGHLSELALNGRLLVNEDGLTVNDPQRVRSALAKLIGEAFRQLAHHCLLQPGVGEECY